MLIAALRHLLDSVRETLTGYLTPDKRIHPEFMRVDCDGRHYNDLMHNCPSRYFHEHTPQVRLLLKATDLRKLDSCPYVARLRTDRRHDSFDYCAFLYAIEDDSQIADIENWARSRNFPGISVLPHGHAGAPAANWNPA